MMEFQTMSMCTPQGCNANCDFCVAKMTAAQKSNKGAVIYNLKRACQLARMGGVTNALITGKGEPTLYPEWVDNYINEASRHFPLIELQTNGLCFTTPAAPSATMGGSWSMDWDKKLTEWSRRGLTTVAISIVHYLDNFNRRIYIDDDNGTVGKPYPPLMDTIKFIHDHFLSVRLNCVGLAGYIDSPSRLQKLLDFAKSADREMQVTWRPVAVPDVACSDDDVAVRARELAVPVQSIMDIRNWAKESGTLLLKLLHGANVYDIKGQNLCLADCLTRDPDEKIICQLIYTTDGRLRYDWTLKGALIL